MPEPLSYSQVITATIALVAVVISFMALHRTSRFQQQQLRFQAKQAELIELQLESLRKATTAVQPAERADVRVDLEKIRKGDYKFIITNWGRVSARDVNFQIRKEDGKSSPLAGDYGQKIPIPELAPGGRCPLIAAISHSTALVFQAEWSWRNPDGSEERRSSQLAL